MCGIVGMAGPGILDRDLKMFEFLMRLSSVRGRDGTGVFQGCFHKNGKNTSLIEKNTLEVSLFFKFNKNKLLLNSTVDNVFIGHTRWATKGRINDESCHPFDVGNIIGVHNGTLEDNKYQSKDTVDSQLLYDDIEKRGLKEVLETLDGNSAYALSFFNKEENKLYFARNKERPLAVCNHKDRNVMYWASEWQMLEYAMRVKNFDIHSIGEFEPGTIYSLDPNDVPRTQVKFDVSEYKMPQRKRTKMSKEVEQLWENFLSQERRKISSSTSSLPSDEGVPWVDDAIDFSKINGFKPPVIGPASNIRNIQTKHGKLPSVNCFTCDTPLNLLEQYRATKVKVEGQTLYECAKCKNLANQILEANKDRVLIN